MSVNEGSMSVHEYTRGFHECPWGFNESDKQPSALAQDHPHHIPMAVKRQYDEMNAIKVKLM